jgi:hypothetical protein
MSGTFRLRNCLPIWCGPGSLATPCRESCCRCERLEHFDTPGISADLLPGLASGLVLPQDDRIRCPVDIGNCRPAEFTGPRTTLTQSGIPIGRKVGKLLTQAIGDRQTGPNSGGPALCCQLSRLDE